MAANSSTPKFLFLSALLLSAQHREKESLIRQLIKIYTDQVEIEETFSVQKIYTKVASYL